LIQISRPCEIGTITIDAICSLRELSESEDKHKDPDLKPKIDDRDWPKTMEAIDDYLGRVLGKENLPSAYVICREARVPATADNPATNYATPNSEVIRRAPHCENNAPSLTYIANNALVANELTKIFTDTSAWTYAKPFIRRCDGCMAYYAVFNHYLGPDNVDNQAAMAEKTLNTLNKQSS
jgi:hypothetical protein